MKFKANKIDLKKLLNGQTEIVLTCEDTKNTLISELNTHIKHFSGELEVSIEKWRNKRSNNHNALFWDMCTYYADSTNDITITANTVYKSIISEYGVSTIYPVQDEILDMVIKDWENRGEGWLTLKLRKSNLDGNYTNVKFWFGSSIYNSKQFWKLVEGLKQECRNVGLDISHYDAALRTSIQAMEEKEKKLEKQHGND